ncbi:MAG: hypothetical protein K9K93_07890 [Acholeplasmataceae bacterium]|nr:hypothetical protein [Acholeplasmataceae bacterium]
MWKWLENQQTLNNPDLPEKGGHWITIVGWADDERITNGGYWIVKNSFGQNWGENGFGKVVYGDNIRINDFHFYYLIDNS